MKLQWSASAREQRMLRVSHTGEVWRETLSYEPLPQPTGPLIESAIAKTANIIGKGIHLGLRLPDGVFHDAFDPNDPTPMLTGPMRRTRGQIFDTIDRVMFSGDLFRKPIGTLATVGYDTIFATPQKVGLDIPETLFGNTQNTAA